MPTNSIDRPVVVGVDASESAIRAVAWAAVDAARHKSPLHLVFAVPVETPLDDSPTRLYYDQYRHTAEQALADAARSAAAIAAPLGGVTTRTFLIDEPPIPTLCALAGTARFVVAGSRGVGAYRRIALGSVSTALSRHARGPVVIVPDHELPTAHGPVVVGVDGSSDSIRAVEVAFDQASRRGADLVAVHAWNPLDYNGSRTADQADQVLADAVAYYVEQYPGVRLTRMVVEDRPVKALLEAAESAQLIVVGSHGTGGFTGMTLGSVGQALLPVTPCPIAIIRSRH
ncbi:universal stress protein [Nocardia goodfellowii]|uniref:Nucleotide-binding universal stress UspA family protein n=1 Tax=Nocardia goodfellowii TaxID=882446 RepID=A0ABS4QI99_9NOCA|nr:universal stress protein [Nocardia goodfellowii]MBP2191380.1 nucleotide-binding universal stress UspA family protein [Nocardia goodfellowii]